jgi:hypothetical protein
LRVRGLSRGRRPPRGAPGGAWLFWSRWALFDPACLAKPGFNVVSVSVD